MHDGSGQLLLYLYYWDPQIHGGGNHHILVHHTQLIIIEYKDNVVEYITTFLTSLYLVHVLRDVKCMSKT